MRSASLSAARAILLAGPVVLAFFSGGYFGEARAWAGLAAWLLVAVAAIASKRPWPRTGAARLAVAALGGLAAWTLLSATWAPLAGPAYHDAQRVTLYAGVLLAATALLDTSAARRAGGRRSRGDGPARPFRRSACRRARPRRGRADRGRVRPFRAAGSLA